MRVTLAQGQIMSLLCSNCPGCLSHAQSKSSSPSNGLKIMACSVPHIALDCLSSCPFLPALFQLQGICCPKGTNRFLPEGHPPICRFCLNALPSDSPMEYSFAAFKSPQTSLLSELYPGHSDELILFKTRSAPFSIPNPP